MGVGGGALQAVKSQNKKKEKSDKSRNQTLENYNVNIPGLNAYISNLHYFHS